MGECIVFAPIQVTEDHIVSGLPSAEAQLYAGGTTYAEGDEAWYNGHAWRSLQGSNTGNTPVEGAWWTDLGEVDQGASVWASDTTYAEGEYAVYEHCLWRSTENSNTGNTPTATATQWQDYGPVNRHRPFDQQLNRYAYLKGSIKYVLDLPSRVTQGFAIFPVGGNLSISKTSGGTEIYSQTTSLVRDSGGYFYNYFFAPIETKTRVLFQDMQAAPGERITVTITGAEDAQVGMAQIAFGYGYEAGTVTPGASIALKGFVRITFDEFGNPVFPARPKQTETNLTVSLPILDNQRLLDILAPISQKACGAFMRDGEDYGLVAYGFLDDVFLENPNVAISNTSIKIIGFQQ